MIAEVDGSTPTTSSPRSPTCSTTSPGTRCATGTWSWPRSSLADDDRAPTTRRVLGEVLDGLLRLLHPFMPFVTETLWTELTGGESVVIAAWPQADPARIDPAAEADRSPSCSRWCWSCAGSVSDQGVKPAQRIPARFTGERARTQAELRSAAAADRAGRRFTPTAALSTGGGRIELDLSTAIDVPAERARLATRPGRGPEGAGADRPEAGQRAFLANAKPDGGQLDPGPQRRRRGRPAPDRGGAGRAAAQRHDRGAPAGRRPGGPAGTAGRCRAAPGDRGRAAGPLGRGQDQPVPGSDRAVAGPARPAAAQLPADPPDRHQRQDLAPRG